MTSAFQTLTCPRCLSGAYVSSPGTKPPCRVSANRAIIVRLAPKRVRRRSRKDSMFDRMKISAIRSIARVLYKMLLTGGRPERVVTEDTDSLHKRATWPVSRSYGASHGDQRRLVSTYVPRSTNPRARGAWTSFGSDT